MKITQIAQNGQERIHLGADPSQIYQKISDLTDVSPNGTPKSDNERPEEKSDKKSIIIQIITQLMSLI